MAFYTGRLGGENFAGFPVRTLAFVRVPPVIPTIPSFDPVTDVAASSLRPRNQTYTYPTSAAPTLTPPVVPAVTAWGQQEPTPVQDFKRQQFTYPESVAPLVPIVSVLVIGWRIDREFQIAQRASVYTYPSWFMNPAPVVAGEIITVDKWYTAPGVPTRTLSTQFLFSAGGFTELVTAAETITVDKWYNQTSRALPGAGTQQYSYASTASFVELVAAAETITMDKWYNRTSTPVLNRAQTQYTFASSIRDTKPPAAVVTGTAEEERIELGSFFGITVPDIDLGIA